MACADLYFSCDIEADGPIPGRYSMSSFGLCVAGRYDGETYEPTDPELHTFYRELTPISDNFDPEAAAVSGLAREHLRRHGSDPTAAMAECAAWVDGLARSHDAEAVFVAYPLAFDIAFMHWYFVAFNDGRDPFGFSFALDIKTMYAVKSASTISRATKRYMPRTLLGSRRHTHNALQDALGQADLFSNVMCWSGEGLSPCGPHPRRT